MLTTFLSEIKGYFDRDFLLNTFFPCLLFVLAALALGIAQVGMDAFLIFWNAQLVESQIILSLGVLITTLFLAYFLRILRTVLIRFYEGYWPSFPVLAWWNKRRRDYYQRRWDYYEARLLYLYEQRESQSAQVANLEVQISNLESKWLLDFPSRKRIMPTRLGNILRAAEEYTMKQYGIDAVVVWPRLYSLLPQEIIDDMQNVQGRMDLLLLMATLAALFGAIGQIVGIFTQHLLLGIVPTLGWFLAILCYASALQVARSYSELIKSTFDLHRSRLLEHLGIVVSNDLEQERKVWQKINDWLYRSYPLNLPDLGEVQEQ